MKKNAGSVVKGGGGGVIKLDVFRRNALTDQRRGQNRVGNVWLQGFFEVEKGKGPGRLCWVLVGGSYAPPSCLAETERLPLVPCVLRSFQSLQLELAEISSSAVIEQADRIMAIFTRNFDLDRGGREARH